MRYTLLIILLVIGSLACNNENAKQPEENATTEAVDSTATEEEAPIKPSQRLPIELKEWVLESYIYKDKEVPGYNFDRPITMTLDHKKVSGYGGCNKFFGKVTLDYAEQKTISFSEIGRTKMACPKRMGHEQRLIELLEGAQFYQSNLAQLTINAGDLGLLRFNLGQEEEE